MTPAPLQRGRSILKLFDFDKLLQEDLGAFGRYQWIVFMSTQLAYACVSGSMLCTLFDNIKPTGFLKHSLTTGNVSINRTFVFDQASNDTLEFCNANTGNITVQYDFVSIFVHFRLFCQHGYMATALTTAIMVGGVLGSILFGQLADRFGRKPICVITLAGEILANLVLLAAPNWESVLVFFLFIGLFGGGYMVVNLVLVLEQVGKNWRLFCTSMNGFPFGCMAMALIGYLAQDWRIYHASLAIVGAPCLICLMFLWESPRWLIQRSRISEAKSVIGSIAALNSRTSPRFSDHYFDEHHGSPPLLVANNNQEKCEIELEKMFQPQTNGELQSNGHILIPSDNSSEATAEDADILQSLIRDTNSPALNNSCSNHDEKEGQIDCEVRMFQPVVKNYSYVDLFRFPSIRKNVLVLSYSWFASAVISFGIYFTLGSLAGNRFFNVFLLGLLKAATGLVPLVLSSCCGRRPIMLAAAVVTCFCCWVPVVTYYSATPHESSDNSTTIQSHGESATSSHSSTTSIYAHAITIIAIIGASAIDPIWKVNHLYSAELFPTAVRNMARGFCNVGSRFGSAIAPNVSYLQDILFPLPYIIFGIISILHVLVSFIFLPETKGKSLPDEMPNDTASDDEKQ